MRIKIYLYLDLDFYNVTQKYYVTVKFSFYVHTVMYAH